MKTAIVLPIYQKNFSAFEEISIRQMLKVFSKLVLLSLQAMCTGPIDYIGDNFCDDVTNNEECQWDGGDCCLDTVLTDYCDDCACLDPGAGDSGTTTAGNKGEGMKGDNFCLSTWQCS